MSGNQADNIKVVVRVRPLNQKEIDSGCTDAWLIEKNTIALLNPLTGKPIPGQLYCFGMHSHFFLNLFSIIFKVFVRFEWVV
jgi:hypothetical protein